MEYAACEGRPIGLGTGAKGVGADGCWVQIVIHLKHEIKKKNLENKTN